MAVLREFIGICESHSVPPSERRAIATEVFRKAANGEQYLAQIKEEFGLAVDMVSQDLEAELGFRTAAALHDGRAQDLICWDSGGASFQITTPSMDGGPLRSYVG